MSVSKGRVKQCREEKCWEDGVRLVSQPDVERMTSDWRDPRWGGGQGERVESGKNQRADRSRKVDLIVIKDS